MGMARNVEGHAMPPIGAGARGGRVQGGNASARKSNENAENGNGHGNAGSSAPYALRSRSNSEETALILASMGKGKFKMAASARRREQDETSDIEAMSDDEEDDEEEDDDERMAVDQQGVGNQRKRRPVHLRHESNRVKSLVSKHISIEELRAHFDRPIIDVAKEFGICITLMKKICRRNGIKRWPHRQIRSLSKSIASMEAAMLSAQGQERDKYRAQIISLRMKRDAVIANPNMDALSSSTPAASSSRPKTPTREHAATSKPHTAPKISPRPTASKSNGNSNSKGGRWTTEEHAAFLEGIRLFGKDWRRVAQVVSSRSAVQTRTHAQKYLLKFAGRIPFDGQSSEATTSNESSVQVNDGQSMNAEGNATMMGATSNEFMLHASTTLMSTEQGALGLSTVTESPEPTTGVSDPSETKVEQVEKKIATAAESPVAP